MAPHLPELVELWMLSPALSGCSPRCLLHGSGVRWPSAETFQQQQASPGKITVFSQISTTEMTWSNGRAGKMDVACGFV